MARELTHKQVAFCHEYIIDWNATRAYKVVYASCKKNSTARSNGYRMLTNADILKYIDSIKNNLEQEAGISRLKVLKEFMKLAFSSIAHFHNTWIDLKEFEALSSEQKACIQEVSTRTVTDDLGRKVDSVKVKLYDKFKALENINKMMGYEKPVQVDLTSKGDKIQIVVANRDGDSFSELMKKRNETS